MVKVFKTLKHVLLQWTRFIGHLRNTMNTKILKILQLF